MRRRTNTGRAVPASRTPDILKCFDADMRVRSSLFADAVSVCTAAVEGPPVVVSGRPEGLRFGEHVIDLSGLLDWLATLAEGGGWAFYFHHHDNFVAELDRIESYSRAAFVRWLRWFRTRPAAEGGANLLGVVGPGLAWLLVIVNDNQGEFRINFFGPAVACRGLRAHLGRQGHAAPDAAPDGWET